MKFISLFDRSVSRFRFTQSFLALAGLAAGAFCTTQSADAALIAYESFNYAAASDLAGQGGWTSTAGTPKIASIGSTYTDSNGNVLASTGNAASLNNSGGFLGVGNTYGGGNGGVYYLSFVAQGTAVTTNANYFMLSLATNGSPASDFGKVPNNANFVWTTRSLSPLAGHAADAYSDTSISDLSLVVIRLDFTDAANAVFHMWVNPDLDAEPSLADADAAGSRGTVSFNGFRIQSNAAGTFDEIRFGTTFADVTPLIPEPSSLALGAIGFGLMLRRKRFPSAV